MKKKLLSVLMVIAMLFCLAPSALAKGGGGHIDVRVAGSLTIETKENGVVTKSETIPVTVTGVTGTLNGNSLSFYKKDGEGKENEWRCDNLNLNPKSDVVVLNFSINYKVDGEEKNTQIQKTYSGENTLKAFINVCPGKSGYDIDLKAEDITEFFTANVGFFTAEGGTIDGGTDPILYENCLIGAAFPGVPATKANAHYEFDGWYPADEEGKQIDDTKVESFPQTVDEDSYYIAKWTPLTYTVIYTDGVDGDDVFQDQKTENLSFGDKTPEFNGTPTREGYRFDSWEPKVEETVTGNATYAATWVKTYTVTYKDGANGTVFEDQATTVDAGSATPVFNGETPERPGYKFAGWDKEIATTVTEDAVYTAQWEEVLVPTQSPSAPADPTPAPTPTDEHPEIAQLIAEGKWGGTPTPTKTATVPQTSDSSSPMLWVVMLVLAAVGLAGVIFLRRRSNNR